jgi:hypothetical protein
VIWSEELTNFVGLPRPYFFSQEKNWFKDGKKYIYKKFPVPFQSKPGDENSVIKLNIKNEKKAVEEGLCSFCGIKIKNKELSIRWAIENQDFVKNKTRDWVPSDFHPLHIECMKQARVYCPFMRTLPDEEFKIALNKENLRIARENYKKYFVIDWENHIERPT